MGSDDVTLNINGYKVNSFSKTDFVYLQSIEKPIVLARYVNGEMWSYGIYEPETAENLMREVEGFTFLQVDKNMLIQEPKE